MKKFIRLFTVKHMDLIFRNILKILVTFTSWLRKSVEDFNEVVFSRFVDLNADPYYTTLSVFFVFFKMFIVLTENKNAQLFVLSFYFVFFICPTLCLAFLDIIIELFRWILKKSSR